MQFSDIIIKTVVSLPFEENTYIVHLKGNAECFVVDPGTEPDKIVKTLDREKLVPQGILVTHGHGDHIAGNAALKERWPDCVLYVGEDDAEKLSDPVKNLSAPFGMAMTSPPADKLLRHGDILSSARISVEARHVPGHSVGHFVFLIKAEPRSMVFVGDTVFRQGIGRGDFPGGNSKLLVQKIRSEILTLPDDTVLFSGHGDETTVGAEKRDNGFLK